MQGKDLTFDFAEGLIEDNLLMVDRETHSVWSQLAGKAVEGEMKEAPLEAIPSIQSTWKYWRETHPETRVMVPVGEEGRPYVYRDFVPGEQRTGDRPTTHDLSTLGLGVAIGGEAWFFPFRELDREPTPIELEIGGKPVIVHYRGDALTAWAEDPAGELLMSVLSYESGWMSFHPDSMVFPAE